MILKCPTDLAGFALAVQSRLCQQMLSKVANVSEDSIVLREAPTILNVMGGLTVRESDLLCPAETVHKVRPEFCAHAETIVLYTR